MQQESLTALVVRHLEAASEASSGRSAHTVYGGHEHALRQTLIALRAGSQLDEHQNPGEATLQVLHGRVTLIAGDDTWNGSLGDLITIPDARHSLERTCRPVGAWQMRGSTLSRPRQRPTAANVFAQVSPTTPTTTVHTR